MIIYKLNNMLDSQKISYTVIDTNYLLPNESVYYNAFEPKIIKKII